MNQKDLIKRRQTAYGFLNEKQLKNALDVITKAVIETKKGDLIDNLYNTETTYKSLLRYTVEGINDPERQKIYNKIILDIFILADDVFGELMIRYGEGYYYETCRTIVYRHLNFYSIAQSFIENAKKLNLIAETCEDTKAAHLDLKRSAHELFEFILTQNSIWKTEMETITEIFAMKETPWYYQAIFTTALTIHLLQRFNIKGVEFIFKLVEKHPDLRIKQRALVGLLLLLYNHDNRIIYYPELVKKLESFKEDPDLLEIIKTIIIQLLRTHETESLVRLMTDEILPGMTKISPNLRNRLDLDNILGENFSEGKNPDWEFIFEDSPELLGKLEEFSKLQMEGSDMFMSTFRMLKQFPFFDDCDNWFLPFFYPNPIIDEILTDPKGQKRYADTLGGFAQSTVMCNSDKYSFIMSIPQMEESQKDMMGKLFISEMEIMSEVEDSDQLIDHNKLALSLSNQYIQDLYRFFKVNPRSNSIINPFSWSFDYYNKWFINLLFQDDELLKRLGDYLFEKNRFKEAGEVFDILEKRAEEAPSMQLLQKQGYCKQQQQKFEEALQFYLKADLYEHGQIWNIKKLALCYRYLKNPEKATEYYKIAENLQPDNLHTQVSIGHCLLEMKDFDEALKYYFKVEYLDPKNKKVWRPIAWCSLELGKFEQAEKYAAKSINKKPAQTDFLNMGHIKWCQGYRMEALEWYRKCVKFKGNTIKDFFDSFENDRHIFDKHNVDSADIPIMMDQLRYFLEDN